MVWQADIATRGGKKTSTIVGISAGRQRARKPVRIRGIYEHQPNDSPEGNMRPARRTLAGSKPTHTDRPGRGCSGRPAMVRIGRPFEPGNKLGRGRPRGSRNKNSLLTRELLDRHGEALVRKAVLQALKGDVPTLRALLAHILPRRTEPPVKTGPLPMGTAEEISQSSQALLEKVASGKITPSQARDIHAMLEAQRKIIETESFDNRLRAIEQRVQGEPGKDPVSLGPADPPA